MLALSEMKVVFVPKKKITLGGEESPTAEQDLNESKVEFLTLHSDDSDGNI